MTCTNKVSNRLMSEKSPYLLQHAHNPVDWYPWGQEALEKAEKENKPIFLSIGYSTCHWCHVMERESFEDKEIAEVINRNYIAVKVDREERPDLDHIYMTYCQAMTGSGGWPLTVILTPDKKPFFAGTYFPKHSKFGRPGLLDILSQIALLWQNEKENVISTANELNAAIAERYSLKKAIQDSSITTLISSKGKESPGVSDWGNKVLNECYSQLEKNFDKEYGGFGSAPKFPSPHTLGFLLRYGVNKPHSKAIEMVKTTLDNMAKGGIWDHIGFGFARYSTDRYWLVPHFEKMLYDNAELAFIYFEAYQLLKDEHYLQIARNILAYVLRDMTSPEGAFYCAEDADSEGEEGKFYVWSKEEIVDILEREFSNKKIGDIFCTAYGITEGGNYEGKNIPNKISKNWKEIADAYNMTAEELELQMELCIQTLYKSRKKRVKPAKDDKILTAWNGLMIAALAKGAQVFTKIDNGERILFLEAAEKAVDFLNTKMISPSGRLMARYRNGESDYLGYLDDYAFLIYGLLELYTACGKPEYLRMSLKLQEEQERLFRDESEGGYFFTGSDAEELLLRPKEIYDGAMPSGNSMTLYNLARLWRITGNEKWLKLAEKQADFFRDSLEDYPPGYCACLQAIQFYLSGGEELILSGPLGIKTLEMQAAVFQDFYPFLVITYNEGTLAHWLPRLKDYPIDEKVSAFLCRDFACQEPVDNPEKLVVLLKRK